MAITIATAREAMPVTLSTIVKVGRRDSIPAVRVADWVRNTASLSDAFLHMKNQQ